MQNLVVVQPRRRRRRRRLLRENDKSVKFLVKQNLKAQLDNRLLEVQRAAQLLQRQVVLDYHQARQLVLCPHRKSPLLIRMQRFLIFYLFCSNLIVLTVLFLTNHECVGSDQEFKLNPNAKSFKPLQAAAARPQSPIPETSFYYPAPVQQMPGMPPAGYGVSSSCCCMLKK